MMLIRLHLVVSFACLSIQEDEVPFVIVRAIRGKPARLPCNVTAPLRDSTGIVLWYKNGTKTPVYSVDWRHRHSTDGQHSNSESLFKDRAQFQVSSGNSALIVHKTRFSDSGFFKCRVDFKSSPTHTEWVRLLIIDPPRSLKLYSAGGVPVASAISVQEGYPVSLSCRAVGGEPPPNVTWWSSNKLLDDEIDEPMSTGSLSTKSSLAIQNDLKRVIISRKLIKSRNITCKASNNPDVAPLSTSVEVLPVKGYPLTVDMTAPTMPLIGGKDYEIACRAEGVQPPPTIAWILRGKTLTENIAVLNAGVSTTESVLLLKAAAADDEKELKCQAVAPSIPHLKAEDEVALQVNYVPEATIKLVTKGRVFTLQHEYLSRDDALQEEAGFSEGDSASFSCNAKANPPTYNTMFLFNGRPLHQGRRIKRKRNQITIQNVTHSDVGLYTCVASNNIGDGQSNAVRLHINYVPVCRNVKEKEVLGLKGEKLQLPCEMLASPKDVTFEWSIAATRIQNEVDTLPWETLDHIDSQLTSQGILYVDNVTDSYIVKCSAKNGIGKTNSPCIFNIKVIEIPAALIGCKHESISSYSANVSCSPSLSGGLTLKFHLQVRDMETNRLIYDTVSPSPKFHVTTLEPERTYAFLFFASHSKGRGPVRSLIIQTRSPMAEKVAPEEIVVSLDDIPLQPDSEFDPETEEGPPKYSTTSLIVGVAAGALVTITILAASLARYRCYHRNNGSSRGQSTKSSDLVMSSKETLFELADATTCDKSTRSSKEETFTSFAPVASILTSGSIGSRHSSPVPVFCPVVTITSSRSTPDVSPKSRRAFHSLRLKDTKRQSALSAAKKDPKSDAEKSLPTCSVHPKETLYEGNDRSENVADGADIITFLNENPLDKELFTTVLTTSATNSSVTSSVATPTQSKNPLSHLDPFHQENAIQGMPSHSTFKPPVALSAMTMPAIPPPTFSSPTPEATTSNRPAFVTWSTRPPPPPNDIQACATASAGAGDAISSNIQQESYLLSFGRLKNQTSVDSDTNTQEKWKTQTYFPHIR